MWQNLSHLKKENEKQKQIGDFEYAKSYCSDLSFARFDDWRLPSRKEFKSIIDKKNKKNNFFKDQFKYNYLESYWTRDSDRYDNTFAWGISMGYGGIFYAHNKKQSSHILCVRDLIPSKNSNIPKEKK